MHLAGMPGMLSIFIIISKKTYDFFSFGTTGED